MDITALLCHTFAYLHRQVLRMKGCCVELLKALRRFGPIVRELIQEYEHICELIKEIPVCTDPDAQRLKEESAEHALQSLFSHSMDTEIIGD